MAKSASNTIKGKIDMQTQFDDFDAQLQCEDVQGDYIPTEQDLLDMEIAFGFNPDELDVTIQISFILYPADAINKIVRLRQYDKWCEDFFGDE